jgi:hypothetical protein
MAVTHSSTLRIDDAWDNTDNANGVSTTRDKLNHTQKYEFADGSGDNQAQEQYHVSASVSPGGDNVVTYDLAGGVLDVFGNTLTLATVKQIRLINKATTNGEDITFGGETGTTGNLFDDFFDGDADSRIKIKAGGEVCVVAPLTGYTITGGTADIIVIENIGTAAITFELVIKGTT